MGNVSGKLEIITVLRARPKPLLKKRHGEGKKRETGVPGESWNLKGG